MNIRETTRADDELKLWMVRNRANGFSAGEIGKAIGMKNTLVRTITNRIRDADAAESGECVDGHYW